MDASVRITPFYILERIFELVQTEQIEPYTMLQHASHSIKATTAPGNFVFLMVLRVFQVFTSTFQCRRQLLKFIEWILQQFNWLCRQITRGQL